MELSRVIEFELCLTPEIRRSDTCGQRVLDRTIVQAGDDGVGDVLKDFDQVFGRFCIICIFFIRTFCGLRCNAILQEVANRTTAIIQWIRLCSEADSIYLGLSSQRCSSLCGLITDVLIRRTAAAVVLGVRGRTVRQGDHVFRREVLHKISVHQVAGFGQACI